MYNNSLVIFHILFSILPFSNCALIWFGTEPGVPDPFLINARHWTPLTMAMVKTLESMMGRTRARRDPTNFGQIPATYTPLVQMVYRRDEQRLRYTDIVKQLEDNLEGPILVIFVRLLHTIHAHMIQWADVASPSQRKKSFEITEQEKAEYLLRGIYLFVRTITEKCLAYFNADPKKATQVWASYSKGIISQVRPVHGSRLRVVFSQFCTGQSDGFRTVLGAWKTQWESNMAFISLTEYFDQKMHLQMELDDNLNAPILNGNGPENMAEKIPIILLTRKKKNTGLFSIKKPFFSIVVDKAEITFTDLGIYLNEPDTLWPPEKWSKTALCGELSKTSIEKVQEILDDMASTTFIHESSISGELATKGNNEFVLMFLFKLIDAGEQQLFPFLEPLIGNKAVKDQSVLRKC